MEESTLKSNDNTIIFTISRMNPPTPGHLLLIQKLIEEAIRQNVEKVFVILSKTTDNIQNPIACQEKINILAENLGPNMVVGLKNQMKMELERQELEPSVLENNKSKIDSIEVIFLCVGQDQLTPIDPLVDIIRNYFRTENLNLFMIIGDDRAEFLDTIANIFLFQNEIINSVDGQILAREDMDSFKGLSNDDLSKLDISTVPISAFSASFVRKLVKQGLKDKFDDVYRHYLTPDKIDHLYKKIADGLLKTESESKKESESKANAKAKPAPIEKAKVSVVKPPKYTYPIVRGDEQFNEIMRINNEKAIEKANDKAAKNKSGGKRKGKTHKKTKKSRKYKRSRKSKKMLTD